MVVFVFTRKDILKDIEAGLPDDIDKGGQLVSQRFKDNFIVAFIVFGGKSSDFLLVRL